MAYLSIIGKLPTVPKNHVNYNLAVTFLAKDAAGRLLQRGDYKARVFQHEGLHPDEDSENPYHPECERPTIYVR